MCGIVGIKTFEKGFFIESCLKFLERLEYRGYDSAGISFFDENNFIVTNKSTGKVANLIDITKFYFGVKINVAISHTRWATHGRVCEKNTHPHRVGIVTIVHNGVIDNYCELKKELRHCRFYSDTDTEVIAALIDDEFKKTGDEKLAFEKALKKLKGSFAILALFENRPGDIFFAKNQTPLIIAMGKKEFYFSSDLVGVDCDNATKAIFLEDGDFGFVSEELFLFNLKEQFELKQQWQKITKNESYTSKGNFEHFMLKEIYDEPYLVRNTVEKYIDFQNNKIRLNGLRGLDLVKKKNLIIIGCGTSYYAGSVAYCFFEKYAKMKTFNKIASEFRYSDFAFNKKDDLYILISQSGETADLIESMKILQKNNLDFISITNAPKSSIARASKYNIFLNSGCEVSVAATKTFTVQVLMLLIFAIRISRKKAIISSKNQEALINELLSLSDSVKRQIDSLDLKKIAKKSIDFQTVIYLAKGAYFHLAEEGALKLREISYMNTLALPAGELKHGSIALVDEKMLCVVLLPNDDLLDKNIIALESVASRGGNVILISSKSSFSALSDLVRSRIIGTIFVEERLDISSIICYATALQLLSYSIAKERDMPIDRPRNLAKCVTVE